MIGPSDLDVLGSRVVPPPSNVSPDIDEGTTDVSCSPFSSKLLLSGGRVTPGGTLHGPDLDVLTTLEGFGFEVIVPVFEAGIKEGLLVSPDIMERTTEVP